MAAYTLPIIASCCLGPGLAAPAAWDSCTVSTSNETTKMNKMRFVFVIFLCVTAGAGVPVV
jgi:hypothetical protein